jgi:uncharacterized protein
VPSVIPNAELFQQHKFEFLSLQPLAWVAHEPLPHVRMDHVLQFMLGDKLL